MFKKTEFVLLLFFYLAILLLGYLKDSATSYYLTISIIFAFSFVVLDRLEKKSLSRENGIKNHEKVGSMSNEVHNFLEENNDNIVDISNHWKKPTTILKFSDHQFLWKPASFFQFISKNTSQYDAIVFICKKTLLGRDEFVSKDLCALLEKEIFILYLISENDNFKDFNVWLDENINLERREQIVALNINNAAEDLNNTAYILSLKERVEIKATFLTTRDDNGYSDIYRPLTSGEIAYHISFISEIEKILNADMDYYSKELFRTWSESSNFIEYIRLYVNDEKIVHLGHTSRKIN